MKMALVLSLQKQCMHLFAQWVYIYLEYCKYKMDVKNLKILLLLLRRQFRYGSVNLGRE